MWSEGMSKARLCDKEMAAVTYNLKQQRVLEKSLQTLKLEEGYALKLLQLDNRIVKVQYKKLKEKVSKIKSHLPAEDISKFRDLDAQGKFRPAQCCVNLGSAVKIAAAARRLHLGAGTRPRTALPRILVQGDSAPGDAGGHAGGGKLKRSSSITGAFIDAPTPGSNRRRPGSAVGVVSPPKHRGRVVPGVTSLSQPGTTMSSQPAAKLAANHKINGTSQTRGSMSQPTINMAPNLKLNTTDQQEHTLSISNDISSDDALEVKQRGLNGDNLATDLPDSSSFNISALRPHVRPSTSAGPKDASLTAGYLDTGTCSPRAPRHESRPRAATAHPKSHSSFSSHGNAAKDARAPQSPLITARSEHRGRRMSCISNDSIDSNLGENLFEERRQELLEEEGMRSRLLDQRTRDFLQDVQTYLEENPPLQTSAPAKLPSKDSLEGPVSIGEGLDGQRPPRLHQRRSDRRAGVEWDSTPTFLPEDQYHTRMVSLWKDMNKCRYLRMPDEKIDLSGVNTLVRDQMKLFETLRTADRAPISGAWETY